MHLLPFNLVEQSEQIDLGRKVSFSKKVVHTWVEIRFLNSNLNINYING